MGPNQFLTTDQVLKPPQDRMMQVPILHLKKWSLREMVGPFQGQRAWDTTGCSWNPASQNPTARGLTSTLSRFPRHLLFLELLLCVEPGARPGGHRDEEDRSVLGVPRCVLSTGNLEDPANVSLALNTDAGTQ